ncbi:unnamed protein product, partial [Rotaria magnacalcarata]
MNDNLHKKFRRQNHVDQHYPSVHPTSTDLSHNNNNNDQIYFPSQLNGDHKNNTNKPANGNGPILSKNCGDDDDDDIVLVSDDDNDDDDDSVDKKSETKNT